MKILKKLLIGLMVIVLLLAIGIFAIWGNEIRTVMSIKKVRGANLDNQDGAVYTMNVKGGFYFDEFLKEGGAESDGELIDFVTAKITKGLIDMGIENPEIGCSSVTLETVEGDRIFGRNYDFDQTNTCIVFTKGKGDRHSTISTVDLQFLGIDKEKGIDGLMDKITCLAAPYAPLDGINSAGVSCGIYMTYQGGEETVSTNQSTDKPDITSTTMPTMWTKPLSLLKSTTCTTAQTPPTITWLLTKAVKVQYLNGCQERASTQPTTTAHSVSW